MSDTATATDMLVRLRRLHRPGTAQFHATGSIRICFECLHRWPCETLRIIGEPYE